MTFQDYFSELILLLSPIHGEGEAISLSNIIAEDVFKIHSINAKQAMTQTLQEKALVIKNELLTGKPLQQILGMADFYGLKFKVNQHVLIPRQETEELVYTILNTLPKSQKVKALDIGTGSGCIPITLKKEATNWEISAIDISPKALQIAATNAANLEVSIEFIQQDILDDSQWFKLKTYDLIVSNPPYIPNSENTLMPDSVKKFEPSIALFVSDDDPLIFYRQIAHFAKKHLSPKGYLFFETNEFNAGQVKDLLQKIGFQKVEIIQDIHQKDRIIRAQIR